MLFSEFRGSDKGWVHASALEEHQTSSSETWDTLTLWHCDFMTSLSLSLSDTHTHICTHALTLPNSHL